MPYTVQQLADLASISVRTLHYYDEIDLLKPSYIQGNGYRCYEDKELILLQQILFYRELDFSLEKIKEIISSKEFNTVTALTEQKSMLEHKRLRLEGLIKTITNTISTMKNKKPLQPDELYDVFKDTDVAQYQDEVQARWGNSDAYKQSMSRVSKMSKAEMDRLKADSKIHTKKIADAMEKGIQDPEVQALIEKSFKGVNFFYNCDYAFFRGLGKMYVDDPRFRATYEKVKPGLAQFMHEAIDYFCDQHQV